MHRAKLIFNHASVHSEAAARRWLKRTITEDWRLPYTIACEDLDSALGEAVSNAWRHGCRDGNNQVRVCAAFNPETSTVVLDVSDQGPGFDVTTPLRMECIGDGEYCASGRFFMQKGCDSVSYERRGIWFVCTLTKRLGRD